ncbi:MAG: FadR/GntR family transcriptional regulator [Sphaerochaeta sp.]|nr:FadR/GntR family transcriptional regulator [Sphaerochaeta sp.]
MEKISRVNLSELIAEKLKNDISRGKYKQGEKLPTHDELCEKWGVSRVTLREALKKLEMFGLVRIYQGRGTYVAQSNSIRINDTFLHESTEAKESMLALLEARKVIETEMARLAARRGSPKELSELGNTLELMERNLDDNDSLEYAVKDFNFHKQIGILCNNNVLLLMLEKIHTLIKDQQRQMSGIGPESNALRDSLKDHLEIFRMIRDHNEEGAAAKMAEHITNMENRIRNQGITIGNKEDLA